MPARDVIVVGSGPSGAHAAATLADAGCGVTLLDVGHEDSTYARLVPDRPFADVRRSDPQQHRYFLGDRFEGVPLDPPGAAPQVTPPRRHVFDGTPALAPVRGLGAELVESLARGGLGGAWGAGCFAFLDHEIVQAGLDPAALRPHYARVARRIGGTTGRDDLAPFFGPVEAPQPPLDVDRHASRILARYDARRAALNGRRVYVGRTPLAVLTAPLEGRIAQRYHDMDFWSNHGGAVYRPDLTIAALEARPAFEYRRRRLVESFEETGDGGVRVRARRIDDGGVDTIEARRVVLAAGALGTTRIVLRSLDRYDTPVPFVCNPHSYVPSLHLAAVGDPPDTRRHSLAQLTLVLDPAGDGRRLVQGQVFSYGPLMHFRLLDQSPLACRESLRLLRALAPALAIWVIQHADDPGPGKTCTLRRDARGRETLEVAYALSAGEARRIETDERAVTAAIRSLGCLPLRRVHPPHGASVHYAGQFPATADDRPLTTEPSGRLRGTASVYVADGAGLASLPAKGLTFTLMANASRVGEQVAATL